MDIGRGDELAGTQSAAASQRLVCHVLQNVDKIVDRNLDSCLIAFLYVLFVGISLCGSHWRNCCSVIQHEEHVQLMVTANEMCYDLIHFITFSSVQ